MSTGSTQIGRGEDNEVVLEGSGDEIEAKATVSGCEPRLTFLKMVGAEHLPDDFVASMKRFKCRGSSGKVNLALDHLPEWSARPGVEHLFGDANIAPDTDYLERAYDEAKYGDFSSRPFMNIIHP